MIGGPIGQMLSMKAGAEPSGVGVSVAGAFHAAMPVTVTAFHETLTAQTSGVAERLQ